MSRRVLVSLGAAAVAALIVVLVWFQPQTLLIDAPVDEPLPVESSTTASVEPTTEPSSGRTEEARRPAAEALRQGAFESRSRYTVRGNAVVYELRDGRRVLRLEKFATTNGPDLRVYLSTGTSADGDDRLAESLLDLGPLKGNRGNQNYELPEGTDLSAYSSAVVWCRRFAVGFGVADLKAS